MRMRWLTLLLLLPLTGCYIDLTLAMNKGKSGTQPPPPPLVPEQEHHEGEHK
jgi:hypothetical protein